MFTYSFVNYYRGFAITGDILGETLPAYRLALKKIARIKSPKKMEVRS